MVSNRIISNSNKLFKRYGFVRCLNTEPVKETEGRVEEIKIPVPWGHVAGKWWGDRNKVPVLALHGWQDNANSFDNLIPLLNLPAVLAIDLPGHGHSSHLPPGKTYDFQDYIIMLHRVIKDSNWTSVPLLTHSFGASLGFAYASIFPDRVKWLVNFECARSLLTLHRHDPSGTFSNALDAYLKIENKKLNDVPPAYKLSETIDMTIEGSLGSISCPESALTLLKRGLSLADQSSISAKREKLSVTTDLQNLIDFEAKVAELLPEEEKKNLKKFYMQIMQTKERAKKSLQNFALDKEKDKYYIFNRDPLIKVQAFQSFNHEFIIEASKHVKCPVLSMRASKGFLNGSTRKLYEHTLDILKTTSPYFEHHEVEGTHHAHLNTPKNLAPIISKFVKRTEQIQSEAPIN